MMMYLHLRVREYRTMTKGGKSKKERRVGTIAVCTLSVESLVIT